MLTLDDVRLRQGSFDLRAALSVESGARVAVIGPSGAGKSTLLAGIAGFLIPQSGSVEMAGVDVSTVPPGERPLSILFQDGNLFPHLTAFQNVALGLRPNLRLDESARAAVMRALNRVGLAGLEDRKPAALSGGQQSRVALARALLRDTPLLLLDEPFAALGPALKVEMLDLVAEISAEKGTTVLMVSHDPEDARRLCDQALLVADGVANPPVPTAELLDNPPESLRAYLGT